MVVRSCRYIFQLLILVGLLIILAITQLPDNNLHVIACDVGQGDAILISYKQTQILTDGGPDSSVLDCLGRHMPFWDKEIELVVLTHPDSDHATGIVDVIQRYNVGSILKNDSDVSTDVYRLLEKSVGSRNVRVLTPKIGMVIRLDLIYLDILSEYDAANKDTNFNSIVYRLKFNSFSGLFTGDISPLVSDGISGRVGKVDYIKVPHHGSVNGLTENLLKSTMPKIAVISVGAKNPWGFPREEILSMLSNYNVKVLRTDKMGDVEVVTDGEKIWWRN